MAIFNVHTHARFSMARVCAPVCRAENCLPSLPSLPSHQKTLGKTHISKTGLPALTENYLP